MASRVVMGLVLVSVFAFATRAEAGSSLVNPVPGSACATMNIAGQMSAPSAISASDNGIKRGQCVSACAAATVECKTVAKDNLACQAQVEGRLFGFEERSCVIDNAGNGANIQSCLATVKTNAGDERVTLRSQLLTALGACDDWGSSCLAACANLSM